MIDSLILKHRYVLTKDGNIRLRFVVGVVLAVFLATTFGLIGHKQPVSEFKPSDRSIYYKPKSQNLPFIKNYDPEAAGNGIAPFYYRIGKRPVFDGSLPTQSTLIVESGDTLSTLMEEAGLTGDDYSAVMSVIKPFVKANDIHPGHEIKVDKTDGKVQSITYILNALKSVVVKKDDVTKEWISKEVEKPTFIKTYAVRTKIESSLFADLGRAGVTDGIINDMIKAYSWAIDFQRDIQGGETVEVLYETKESEDGEYVRSNKLLYANLILKNKEIPVHLFEKEKGYSMYFDEKGVSIRRALMKTPIDGARLSSGFGMRRHPVLGFNKMHKGVDFAAPTGTPIFAAGDGVVEKASRFSAYGNYIRIRHNSTFKTAYAHLSRYAKGITPGRRVKQGEVIGYVGTTGRSTGPHLHYEVHKNGVQINPHSVDVPLGEELSGKTLERFKATVATRKKLFANNLPQ